MMSRCVYEENNKYVYGYKRIKPILRSNNGFSNDDVKNVAIHKNKKFIFFILNYIVVKTQVTKKKKKTVY